MSSWETPAPGPAYSDNPWQVFLPPSLKYSEEEETRQAKRLSYPFPQRYAPYREDRWPQADEFQAVDLCDISTTGLALLMPQRPTCSQFVVELGIGTNVSQVLVQVIQVTPVTAPLVDKKDSHHYRIGCEILPPSASDSDNPKI